MHSYNQPAGQEFRRSCRTDRRPPFTTVRVGQKAAECKTFQTFYHQVITSVTSLHPMGRSFRKRLAF